MNHYCQSKSFSQIEFKSIDEEKRIIEGIATTPTPDRVDDIVDPLGSEFELPLPFLLQHKDTQSVGHVVYAEPTAGGIFVRVQLAKCDEPGILKDQLDYAWQMIKLRLVKGLSIRFRSIDYEVLPTGGIHFKRWEWLELSAVTIPANADGKITSVKKLSESDEAAAIGSQTAEPEKPAGDTAKHHIVQLKAQSGQGVKLS